MLRFAKAEQWVFVVIVFIIMLISKKSKLHRNSHAIEKASSMCLQKIVPMGIKSVESQKPKHTEK